MNHPENLTPTQALELLVEGNGRFVSNLRSIETVISTDKLKNITENGQSPFSVILTCSDSRIPTEIVFDRGLGDLFVIRIAGNIISPSIIGSIEFAASSFGTQLCLVMGHTHCGAVQAALGAGLDGVQFSGNIEKIVQKISPSVNAVISAKGSADRQVLEHQVAVENVRRSVELITRRSAPMRKLVEQKKFMIVGALYDVVTGQVDFELPEEFATDENVDFLSAQFKKHSPRVVPSPKADQKF